jgi:hypothetical protein
MSHSLVSRDPETQSDRDVTPTKGARGGSAIKSMSQIKREKNSEGKKPQEGIDSPGKPRLVLGAPRCWTDSTRE